MRTSSDLLRESRRQSLTHYRLSPQNDEDDAVRSVPGGGRRPAPHEDLPYKVELWNADKTVVEQVLAVTANGSIGYAAYYAATREYPDRYVSLRHKGSIIARFNGPGH